MYTLPTGMLPEVLRVAKKIVADPPGADASGLAQVLYERATKVIRLRAVTGGQVDQAAARELYHAYREADPAWEVSMHAKYGGVVYI